MSAAYWAMRSQAEKVRQSMLKQDLQQEMMTRTITTSIRRPGDNIYSRIIPVPNNLPSHITFTIVPANDIEDLEQGQHTPNMAKVPEITPQALESADNEPESDEPFQYEPEPELTGAELRTRIETGKAKSTSRYRR